MSNPYATSAVELPIQIWQPDVDPENPPTTFKPTSLSVYAQHSRGFWQLKNGANSSIYIIMMSTRNNDGTVFTVTNDTVAPLAHCSTFEDANKNPNALARQYKDAEIVKDIDVGHHFNIVGEHKTRTFWAKEVAHARSLKWINLDDVDGDMQDEWVGDGNVEK